MVFSIVGRFCFAVLAPALIGAGIYALVVQTETGPQTPAAEIGRGSSVAHPGAPIQTAVIAETVPARAADTVPAASGPLMRPSAHIPESAVATGATAGLTLQLQQELRRVGCLEGDADGVWSAETQQATRELLKYHDAEMTVALPDAAVVAMVQATAGQACLKSCPEAAGACVPTARVAVPAWTTTVARARKAPQAGAIAAAAAAAVAPPAGAVIAEPVARAAAAGETNLPGAMALGAQREEPAPAVDVPVAADKPAVKVPATVASQAVDKRPTPAQSAPSAKARHKKTVDDMITKLYRDPANIN